MSTIWLKLRMALVLGLLFGLIYALLVLVMVLVGFGTPILFALFAVAIILIQYVSGPKAVEWSARVRYVEPHEEPELHAMVDELAMKAKIPKPKVGISDMPIANAFAFGRSKKSGRVCVTRRLMQRLDRDELKAVLAHELSHIKHRDMAVVTMVSVIPMIAYFAFWSMLWGRRGRSSGNAVAIALVALVVYFISNLLVLYVSRIREYYADQGAAELTGQPHYLASALYRISYDTAVIDRRQIKGSEGMKAFFASDISRASKDVTELRDADVNQDGHLDRDEVQLFAQRANVKGTARMLELMSTHPNMVKRVQRLSKL